MSKKTTISIPKNIKKFIDEYKPRGMTYGLFLTRLIEIILSCKSCKKKFDVLIGQGKRGIE